MLVYQIQSTVVKSYGKVHVRIFIPSILLFQTLF